MWFRQKITHSSYYKTIQNKISLFFQMNSNTINASYKIRWKKKERHNTQYKTIDSKSLKNKQDTPKPILHKAERSARGRSGYCFLKQNPLEEMISSAAENLK